METLRKKKIEELEELLEKNLSEYESTIEKLLQGKEKNTAKPKMKRREIARIKTVINEKKESSEGVSSEVADKKI